MTAYYRSYIALTEREIRNLKDDITRVNHYVTQLAIEEIIARKEREIKGMIKENGGAGHARV